MEKVSKFFSLLFFAFSLVLTMGTEVTGCIHTEEHGSRRHRHWKLFVFGDSFADTGNIEKLDRNLSREWYKPYGMTFPKRPSGRFSDGRVLTDYVASFLGIRSPVPYKYRRVGCKLLPYGMNFALGGTGVFDTGNGQSNLSAQISAFQGEIEAGVFSLCDIKSSVALVSIAGNDYLYYDDVHGTDGIFKIIDRVVGQLALDLKRLYDLGVPKVVVTNLHPMGCSPFLTRKLNYSECNFVANFGVDIHNGGIEDAIKNITRKEDGRKKVGGAINGTFHILDLNKAFSSVLNQVQEAKKFKQVHRPCCESNTNEAYCGDLDKEGIEQYTLCHDPNFYFFWDDVHPTQAAWSAVFEYLKPALGRFLSL